MTGTYLLDPGPYFLGILIIAFALAIVSIWWSRSVVFKIIALISLGSAVWLGWTAIGAYNERIRYVVDNLLSQPKPITYAALLEMLPEDHPGHLVLYGEPKGKAGIYLLLRSPHIPEPRYYIMEATKEQQKSFQKAKREAKEKNTQLLLGRKRKGKDGSQEGTKGTSGGSPGENDRTRGGGSNEGEHIFHPAPVAGGPEKAVRPQDQPIHLETPSDGR